MKKVSLSLLLLVVIGAVDAFAGGIHFDAKTWGGLHTYDVRTVNKDLQAHAGELVMLKFNFRGKDIHHIKPSWYESSIWQPDPQGKKGFSEVRVMVSTNDLPAFKSITTNSTSGAEMTIYGRILHEPENNFVFLRLIGRNAVVGPSGNAVVSW
jgi:hypothetical protein